jgi:SAM-dependent methyltransferase
VTSYAGRHAELYDLFYASKPYGEEARFVDRQLRAHASGPTRRVLDLACGTGSHALELAALGYEVVGVDYSEAMLRRASAKAVPGPGSARFEVGDMRALRLDGPPFDAVICLFDAIGYAQTNEALLATLRSVRAHLRPGGLFLFEFWHAAAMLRGFDPVRVRRFATGDSEVLRVSETALDVARQLARVAYSVYELKPDGTYEAFAETQVNRYFLVQEMAGWLESVGLSPIEWFGGFADEQVDERTWHVVALARAPG